MRQPPQIDIECCRNYNSRKVTGFWFLLSPNLFPNNVLLVKSAAGEDTASVPGVVEPGAGQLWQCVVLVTTFAELTTGHCVLCNYHRLGTLVL